ncbi:MAG: transposase [Bacteroidota bacterium]
MGELLSRKDQGQDLPADSAYTSAGQVATIAKNGMISKVHEKRSRNHLLTEAQKQANREKSKTRARVEHVFGFRASLKTHFQF